MSGRSCESCTSSSLLIGNDLKQKEKKIGQEREAIVTPPPPLKRKKKARLVCYIESLHLGRTRQPQAMKMSVMRCSLK